MSFVPVSHSDTQQQHSALPLAQSNKEVFCRGFEEHAVDKQTASECQPQKAVQTWSERQPEEQGKRNFELFTYIDVYEHIWQTIQSKSHKYPGVSFSLL